MEGKQYFGKHWMYIEGDLIQAKYVGVITLADVQAMRSLDSELVPGRTYYIIADVSEVSGMEAAARKASTEWFARQNIGGCVNFGIGLATRAISAFILSLLRLIHKHNMPTHFVRTEEEARAWVAEQRQRRAAHKSGA